MCLILIKPKGIKYTSKIKDYCTEAYKTNNDSVGYSLLKDSKLKVEKNIKLNDLFDFLDTIKIDKHDTLMIHFRFATHGEKSTMNSHPFLLSDSVTSELGFENIQNCKSINSDIFTAVMHNGIISDFSKNTVKKSDTYNFCEIFLNKTSTTLPSIKNYSLLYKIKDDSSYDNVNLLTKLNSLSPIFQSNKFAFLNAKKGLLIMGKGWYKDSHGLLHSNACAVKATNKLNLIT